jgi:deazaflavin-dependent oxidoreductase (nitroreductase family)
MLLFLRRDLHLSAGHIGVLLGLGGVGGVVGAVVAARLAARIGVGPAIVWSLALAGLGEVAYPLATRSTADVLIVAGGLLVSAGGVAYNINQVSLRQALCPLALQGRMNASVRFVVWGTMPVGGLLGGVLGGAVGLRSTLWIAGAGAFSAFLWLLGSPVPGVRTMPAVRSVAGRVGRVPGMPLEGEYDPSPSQWVRKQVEEYESSGGQQGNTLMDTGLPVVIVTTRGNKSGKLRKTPLMRVEHDGKYALVASKGGAPKHPVWYYNLKADPDAVTVQDGPEPFDVTVRELDGDERSEWMARAIAAFPQYAEYEAKTERKIPVFLTTRRG